MFDFYRALFYTLFGEFRFFARSFFPISRNVHLFLPFFWKLLHTQMKILQKFSVINSQSVEREQKRALRAAEVAPCRSSMCSSDKKTRGRQPRSPCRRVCAAFSLPARLPRQQKTARQFAARRVHPVSAFRFSVFRFCPRVPRSR